MIPEPDSWLELTGCRVDLVRGTVVPTDTRVSASVLTTIERRLLDHLARNADRAVSRDELLGDVWGYRGQVVTRTVDVTVRRLRTKLEVDPATPTHIVTVHGHGYRFAGQVPGGLTATTSPLPPELTALIGRDDDVRTVQERLEAGARVVTITGAGGIGKSRLALHVAHRQRTGAAVVELADATDDRSTIAAVASALGVYLNGSTVPAATDRVARALSRRPGTLVVLDNALAVVGVLPDLLMQWLASTDVRFVVTSRAVLRIAGEQVHAVGPLAADDAVALYHHCRADHTGRVVDHDSIARLVHALDGNPLAIELAAARGAVLSPSDLLARLDDRLTLLSAPAAQVQHRHGSLRAVIETSWSMLGPVERRVAARCSVFRGGFDLSAAEAVADVGCLDAVESLVHHSLLRVVDAPTGLRFRMDGSVAVFLREQLEDALAVAQTHARWAAKVGGAELARLRGPDGRRALERLHSERDNLLAALHATDDPDVALALGLVWQALGTARGPLAVRDEAVAIALRKGEGGSSDRFAELLIGRLEPMRSASEPDELRADIERGRSITTRPDVLAQADLAQAALCYRIGEVTRAQALAEAAHAALPGAVRTDALVLLGRCRQRLEGPEAARQTLAQAVAEAVALGDRLGEARARYFAAFVEERTGRIEVAAKRLAQACACYSELGDVSGEATARVSLAGVHLDHGQVQAAAEQLEKATSLARSVGDLYSEGIALINLGNLHLATDDAATAAACFRDAVAVLHRQGAPADEAVAMANLGVIERDHAQLTEVVTRCDALGLDMLGSICCAWLAALHARADALGQADDALARARSLANAASMETVEVLAAVVAHAHGEDAQALRARVPGPDARVDERIAGAFLAECLRA